MEMRISIVEIIQIFGNYNRKGNGNICKRKDPWFNVETLAHLSVDILIVGKLRHNLFSFRHLLRMFG